MTTEAKIEFYTYAQASEILGKEVRTSVGACTYCAYISEEFDDMCASANCWGGIMLDSNKYNTTPMPITNDFDR